MVFRSVKPIMYSWNPRESIQSNYIHYVVYRPIRGDRGETGSLSNTTLLGTTSVFLPNGISFLPTVLAGCTSVRDGQTDHATVTPVAISRIAIAMSPNNGHDSRDIEDTKTEMLKKPILNTIFSFDVPSPRNPREYPHKPYRLLPESRLFAERIFISFTVSRNCLQKSQSPTLDVPARKQNLAWNIHSRSFKVTHFGISENPTRDSISLYNNADLIL